MQPPQDPASPWPANPRRRDMPPPIFSPSFSRSAFPAAPAAAGDPAVSEHPCVSLLEWWLASVEGDNQKIAVAGIFERNQTIQQFTPAPIAKRHEPCVLETEDGIIVLIHGSMNISRMLDDGYSTKVCEEFVIGFPHWWQSCNILYPKALKSRAGSQLRSSYTNNSGMDSTRFYLEKFQLGRQLHSLGSSLIDDLLNNAKSFSHNNTDAFQKSSFLPNGTPRFEECGCDGDIATNEKAAAPKGGDTERYGAVCTEVANMEVGLLAGSTFGVTGHSDIETVSLEFIVDCANDAGNEEADNAPTTGDQRTPVAPLKGQGCQEETQHIAFSNKAVADEDMPASVSLDVQHSSYLSDGAARFEEYTCVGDIPTIQTTEKTAASNDDCERRADVSKEVDSVEIGLIVGSTLREPGHGENATDVSLGPTVECTNDAGNEGSDDRPPTGREETPVPYLKSQGCSKGVADEAMPASAYLDVHNFSHLSAGPPRSEEYTCAGDISTNEMAAASNDDSERYVPVSKEMDNVEIGLIVGGKLRERGHSDTASNISLAPTEEYTDDSGRKKAPVVYLKRRGCPRKPQHVALEKMAPDQEMRTPVYSDAQFPDKPVGLRKEQRSAHKKKLQGATRLPVTRSPIPYAHQSPLTRGMAMSLSMSTPEALKLRKTRSGRVVVPTLDAGCQRIIYDIDGSISGVVGLDSASPPKGGKLEVYTRKKRKAP